jgi:hypothetical protein
MDSTVMRYDQQHKVGARNKKKLLGWGGFTHLRGRDNILSTSVTQVPPPGFYFFLQPTSQVTNWIQENLLRHLQATYPLRGGEYKDPITPPCGILLRLSADTLLLAI